MGRIEFRVKIKGDAGVYHVWAIDWYKQKAYIERNCGNEWVALDKIEAFLQLTPLKDKNGTEMYEGDIFLWMGKAKRVIAWHDEAFEWTTISNLEGVPDIELAHWKIHGNDTIEVIGNINKNPELFNA